MRKITQEEFNKYVDDVISGKEIIQDWQKFCIYNLLGFYLKGTDERRYKEAFIFIPRKNGEHLVAEMIDKFNAMKSFYEGE